MEKVNKEIFSSDLSIKQKDFNGTLDFLYQLIIERKKSILEINILDVANTFVLYVKNNIHKIEIDSIIDSLLMVTHLIEIKSKKLLPVHESGKNIDSEIERDKFIQRVLMYKKFKDIVVHLNEKYSDRKLMIDRSDFDEEETLNNQIIEELPDFVSPEKLLKAMKNIYNEISEERKFEKIVNIGIKELSIDEITNEMLEIILNSQKNSKITLKFLLNSIPKKNLTKQYFSVSFVAILVLTRNGLISIYQDLNIDDDIYIKIIDLNLSYELEKPESKN